MRALAIGLLLLAAPVSAPVMAQMVVSKPVMTLAGADAALTAAGAKAVAMGLKVTVVVVDPSGVPIAMRRMDGASLLGPDIALAKARTAAGFKRPTKAMQESLMAPEGLRLLTLPATLVDGAVPVMAGGELVGAIGVSGATSAQDGEIAAAGAAAVK